MPDYDHDVALELLASLGERTDPTQSGGERLAAEERLLEELLKLDGRAHIQVERNGRVLWVTVAGATVTVGHNSGKFRVRREDGPWPTVEVPLTYNRAKQKFEGALLPTPKDDVEKVQRRDALVELAAAIVRALGGPQPESIPVR